MTTTLETAPTKAPVPAPRGAARALRALAAVECRRLVRHPATLAGTALAALHLVGLLLGADGYVLSRESVVVQSAALTMAAGVLVATFLMASRTRRDDTAEQLGPASHGEDLLTRALLLAVAGPTVLAAVLVTVAFGWFVLQGGIGGVVPSEALTAPAAVAFGGVVGVALGRLAPARATPLVAIALLGIGHVWLVSVDGEAAARLEQLFGVVVLPQGVLVDVSVAVRPAGWHLAYVLALTALVAAATTLLQRPTALRTGWTLLAIGAVAVTAVVQARPPSPETVAEVAARVTDPAGASECETTPTATVCALATYTPWRADWAAVAEAVRRPLLDAGLETRPLTIVQRADFWTATYALKRNPPPSIGTAGIDELVALPEDAFAEVTETDRIVVLPDWAADGPDHAPARLALAHLVARGAVGLPSQVTYETLDDTGSTTGSTPCNATGQAREVIALWLAIQGDDHARRTLASTLDDDPYPTLNDAAPPPTASLLLGWPGIETPQGSVSKVAAALALTLAERETADVLAVLGPDWQRWTSPDATVSALVTELSLDAPPDGDALADAFGQEQLARFYSFTPPVSWDLDVDGVARGTQAELDAVFEAGATGCP